MNIDLIEIWTDGSCNNKTHANGGYGIVLKYGEHEKHIFGGSYINTTSARMEIRGVLEALRSITNKTIPVTLYCDNRYVVDSVALDWMYDWERNYWITKDGLRKNHDLWKQMIIEIKKFSKKPRFIHVHGHNGNHYNEICDRLAAKGGKNETIIDDSENK